ncbi:MAG: MerR family transcriptional regulator [Oscillospiraceae bacterium]|nr:MerR family transcriptional regulator [Oscillospiraceae bacterium]
MEKYRAIPEGYMTVGEVAKKMDTTVRTLQYYDREGLLSPSAESEGGRRLYTDKDVVKLHQILSLKFLGFSLDDIKNRLVALDTPRDVANALSEHAAAIRKKMEALIDSLNAIEALKEEVLQMQTVDFKKYASIIVNLQIKNDFYQMVKHLDDDLLERLRSRFDKKSAKSFVERLTHIMDEASSLQDADVPPEDAKGLTLAKAFWDIMLEFTGGDLNMIAAMDALYESTEDSASKKRLTRFHNFMHPALELYFATLDHNPFGEMKEGDM